MADRPFGFRTHPSVTSSATPEAVFHVIADLRNHLIWSGERAESDGFKMLTLEAPPGPATVGTTFTSSGSAGKDTFHDRSVVTEVSPPRTFVIETDARLERVLTCDPGIGVARHADAGYPEAIATADRLGVTLPMRGPVAEVAP